MINAFTFTTGRLISNKKTKKKKKLWPRAKEEGGDGRRCGAKNSFPPCATVGVINPPVLTHAGHFLWLQALPGVPPYLVPNSNGHLDSPSLSSFYMFFTMIILLQVEESDCVYEREKGFI